MLYRIKSIILIISTAWILGLSCGPPRIEEMPVVNELQARADFSGDGWLGMEEVDELLMVLKFDLKEPHHIGNPILEIFDGNHDGFLDDREVDTGRNLISFGLAPRIFETNPGLARRFDRNQNNRIDDFESQAIKNLLFFDSPLNRPRNVEPQEGWSQAMDLNDDGFVDDGEIETVIDTLLHELIRIPADINQLLKETTPREPDPGEPAQPQGMGIPVENRIQEIMDLNNDGILNRFEAQEAIRLYEEAHLKTGNVEDPESFRARFDLNRDGRITKAELDKIDEVFMAVRKQYPEAEGPEEGLPLREPVDKMFDLNDNDIIEPDELQKLSNLFAQLEKRPHKAENEVDNRLDLNRDNFITLEEIRTVGNRLNELNMESRQFNRVVEEKKPVDNLLEELADTNNDRFLDPEEMRTAEKSLSQPHRVQTPFDRRIDFNENGEIEQHEIEKALRAGEVWLDERQEELPEKVKRQTPIDGIFDLDENGFIDKQEVEAAVDFFIMGPRSVNHEFKLARIFDLNKDGFFQEGEMIFILDNFLRPHPANYDLDIDQRSDTNGNFFIEPEEIGIAAGVTEAGIFPAFEAMIEQKSIRHTDADDSDSMKNDQEAKPPVDDNRDIEDKKEPTPTPTAQPAATGNREDSGDKTTIYQKKIDLKNKKIAVVDLNIGSDIEKDFSDAIIMFAENAFVNIGTASVVDRQNITKIIEEYQFQASDLSDATTAVQIGKLAGADVIVIGNLNYIGKKYYLNIKLINVTTAEILGSSIETADDDTEFFDMCNTAVSKLF